MYFVSTVPRLTCSVLDTGIVPLNGTNTLIVYVRKSSFVSDTLGAAQATGQYEYFRLSGFGHTPRWIRWLLDHVNTEPLLGLYCEKNYNGSIVGIVQYQRPNPVAWSLKPSLSCDVCCRLITSISLSIMIKERKERRKIKPQTNKEDCALILYQGLTRVHILR